MKFCSNCGKELLPDSVVCSYCGYVTNNDFKKKHLTNDPIAEGALIGWLAVVYFAFMIGLGFLLSFMMFL